MPNPLHLKRTVLSIALSVGIVASALAQATESEKPKLKDFGSSLKRLKWDAEKKVAVEKKSNKKSTVAEDDVVKVETNLVLSDVLVLDKNYRIVQGLTSDDFIVSEDGKLQEVGAFSLGDDANMPRSIVLIIDYSSSQFPFIQTSVKAAKTLVDKLNPRDTMAIVTDDVELLVDFTEDKELLKRKLDSLEKKATSGGWLSTRKFGRSAQYSALMATLMEAFNDEDQRPLIIFQTDGDELGFLRNSTSLDSIPPNLPPDLQEKALRARKLWQEAYWKNVRQFSLDDVYKAAENSRATIYAIIPGLRLIGLPSDKQVERFKANRQIMLQQIWGVNAELRRKAEEEFSRWPPEAVKYMAQRTSESQLALAGLAKVAGGWSDFLEDSSQADAVYDRIFSDINRRYIVGYYPTNKERDGKRRTVNVEVRGHPEYVVWGRKSYYAPGPEE